MELTSLSLIRALMDCKSPSNPVFPTIARLTLCLCANIASREPREVPVLPFLFTKLITNSIYGYGESIWTH